MKEVLTKRFWQDVKKIFDEAREEKPAAKEEPVKPPVQADATAKERPQAPPPVPSEPQ